MLGLPQVECVGREPMHRNGLLVVLMMIVLSGCALWEDPPTQPQPPLTLPPEPTLSFSGSCTNNRVLADWLQYSTYYVEQFSELVTATAAAHGLEMRESVVAIAALRDEYAPTVTPDCAEPG